MPRLNDGLGCHMKFWGVKCKTCGLMDPTAMFRDGDASGRFRAQELFSYK